MAQLDPTAARAAVLARYPDADVDHDDDAFWISDDDWTPIGNECATEEDAWLDAAQRIERQKGLT